jgi:hypothetical protein
MQEHEKSWSFHHQTWPTHLFFPCWFRRSFCLFGQERSLKLFKAHFFRASQTASRWRTTEAQKTIPRNWPRAVSGTVPSFSPLNRIGTLSCPFSWFYLQQNATPKYNAWMDKWKGKKKLRFSSTRIAPHPCTPELALGLRAAAAAAPCRTSHLLRLPGTAHPAVSPSCSACSAATPPSDEPPASSPLHTQPPSPQIGTEDEMATPSPPFDRRRGDLPVRRWQGPRLQPPIGFLELILPDKFLLAATGIYLLPVFTCIFTVLSRRFAKLPISSCIVMVSCCSADVQFTRSISLDVN